MIQRSILTITILTVLFVQNAIFAQWKQVIGPIGFDSATVNSLVAANTFLFAGNYYNYGVLRSTDYGTTWKAINTGLTNKWVFSLCVVGNNIFAGTDGAGVYRSTNEGQNWVQMNSGLTGWQDSVYHVTSFFVFKDTNIFIGTYKGIFLSTNYGTTWAEKSNGLVLLPTSSLTAIGDNLFALTNSGVFRSTNNGTSWTIANNGITSTIITCLLADNNNLYVGTIGDGIFHSTDYGANWLLINNGLTLTSSSVLTLVKIDSNLFAGTWDGVYMSSNNGTKWNVFNTGLNVISINSIAKCGTNIFAGTERSGLWYRPLSESVTSVKEIEKSKIPQQYSLKQNYPNPFNPITTIEFELPVRSYISIKVYDLLGRMVSIIDSKELPAGKYSRQWNGEKYPSGVYFYLLEVEGYREIKKLVLLK